MTTKYNAILTPRMIFLRGGRGARVQSSIQATALLSTSCSPRYSIRELGTQHLPSWPVSSRADFAMNQSTSTPPAFIARSLSSSSSTHFLDEDEDGSIGTYVVGHIPTVAISSDGQQVSITNVCAHHDEKHGTSSATTSCWTFSSPLLWVNDPQSVHPSSGQRMRTLGQLARDAAISHAEIVVISADDDDHHHHHDVNASNNNSFSSVLHPPPLPGSFHPRGGIYSFDKPMNDTRTNLQRKLLRLEWNTGEISYFDLQWLLDHAILGRMGRRMSLTEFVSETNEPRKERFGKKAMTFGAVANESSSNATRVSKDIAIRAMASNDGADVARTIPTLEYRDVMVQDDMLFMAMQGIFEHGAILIRNAPVLLEDEQYDNELFHIEQESIVGNLGKKFSGGTLSHGSLYGDIFHVQSKNGAENIAYTNVALPPHQDLAYYESKPFLQLLHCVHSDKPTDRIIGGESVLVDAMAAAEELRLLAPDLFDILCQTEATFLKEREGADIVSPKPHIVTDPTFGHVVGINWSPPFEGPMQLHPRISVEEYVRAYQAMECMLDDRWGTNKRDFKSLLPGTLESELKNYAQQFTWEYALKRGDILVLNNQRMLHGRREFSALGNGQRHLIGCYTDAMDTISNYRQMLRERGGTGGGGNGKRNPGSGYRWI